MTKVVKVGEFRDYCEKNGVSWEEINEEVREKIERLDENTKLIIAKKTTGYLETSDEELCGLHCVFVDYDGKSWYCGTDGISPWTTIPADEVIFEDEELIVITEEKFYEYFDYIDEDEELREAEEWAKENANVWVSLYVDAEGVRWPGTVIINVPDEITASDLNREYGYVFYKFEELNDRLKRLSRAGNIIVYRKISDKERLEELEKAIESTEDPDVRAALQMEWEDLYYKVYGWADFLGG